MEEYDGDLKLCGWIIRARSHTRELPVVVTCGLLVLIRRDRGVFQAGRVGICYG